MVGGGAGAGGGGGAPDSVCEKRKKGNENGSEFPRGRLIKLWTGKALQMTAFLVNIARLYLAASASQRSAERHLLFGVKLQH